MNNGTNGTASGKHRKAGSNGKTSGFGNFFKRSNSSSSSKKLDNVAYGETLHLRIAISPTSLFQTFLQMTDIPPCGRGELTSISAVSMIFGE